MKHIIDQMVHLGLSLTCRGKPEWTFWSTQYLSFYEWLIVHVTMFLRFIHVVTYGRISLIFYGWIILHCMYILYSLYPFIQRWTFDCFYISQSWIMLHWRRGAYIFSRFQFSFFWTNNQKWIVASYGNTIFNYLRKCHVAFYRGYTIYIPNNIVQKCQILCMFTNTFCPFKTYLDHFNRSKIISLYDFDLHFIISDAEHLFIHVLVIWIYSSEKRKAFLLRLETKQKCPLSPLLSYILLKVVDRATSKKRNKGI